MKKGFAERMLDKPWNFKLHPYLVWHGVAHTL